MKSVHKLTQHFLDEVPELSQITVHQEIQAYSRSLLDYQNCGVCHQGYSITQLTKLPRILVHCGHTFCTQCLSQFFIKNRIRCPACLKLIKKLNCTEQLPINHTIYQKLCKKQSGQTDPYKFLCADFTISCNNRIRETTPPEIDEESGLNYCSFHPQKIEHFFCVYHDVPGCRECMEVRHKRGQCKIMDLYEMIKPK